MPTSQCMYRYMQLLISFVLSASTSFIRFGTCSVCDGEGRTACAVSCMLAFACCIDPCTRIIIHTELSFEHHKYYVYWISTQGVSLWSQLRAMMKSECLCVQCNYPFLTSCMNSCCFVYIYAIRIRIYSMVVRSLPIYMVHLNNIRPKVTYLPRH